MNHLLSFFGSFGAAFFLTWYVRRFAVAKGWTAPPDSDRHVHNTPIPRIGGVAVFLAFCATTAFLLIAAKLFGFSLGFSLRRWMGLLGPATLIFIVGLYDDFRATSPYLKFLVETAAAVWLFLEGFRIVHVPLLFKSDLPFYLSLAATIFWVLLITNAFNLIDGLDGLAAGSALFSTIVVFVISLLGRSFFVSISSAALAGCILGFLRFNFHPATIFLGDCGSLFIGFVLSALGLASSQKSPTILAVAIPVVGCGLPVLETGLSVLRRFLNSKPLFRADREHIHHKLLALGLSQRQVTVMLYGVSAFFAAVSLLLLNHSGKTLGLLMVVVGTVVWVALQRLGYLEMSELQRVAQRTIEQKRIIANNLSIRRAVEKLKTCERLDQICDILHEAFENNEFDRFELKFPLPIDRLVDVAPLSRSEDSITYTWAKPSNAELKAAYWTLAVQLPSTRTWRQGSLVLYRAYQRVPLRMDVNLVTSFFQFSLADALDRALENAEFAVLPQRGERSVAATAS